MKILLVNDDGIDAPGIRALIDRLSKENDIIISAPDGQRSGYSHSINYMHPIVVKERKIQGHENIKAYAVGGSPADCVKLAVHALFKDEKIDMVISGINDGPNLGRDICYSGTFGAAMEAAIHGLRAIAISCYAETKSPAFEFAADFLAEYIKTTDISFVPIDTVININVPDAVNGKVKGVAITRQSGRYYKEKYDVAEVDDEMLYQLTDDGDLPLEEGTDVHAIMNGYISITPLRYDRTDNYCFDMMKK